MFDIGWPEMLVVAVVAIIVVGPKDLPGMLRSFGRTVKKLRAMAGDFQRQFDDALKESELDGIKDTVNQVRTLDPTRSLKDKLNPLKGDMLDIEQPKPISHDYDPAELFDEDKAPAVEEPVKVDVDAAIKKNAAVKKPRQKSSKKNAASKPKAATTKSRSVSAKAKTTTRKPATKATKTGPSAAKPKSTKRSSTAKKRNADA